MGSGKTTASKLLAESLGFKLFEEQVSENKFLPLYYKDPTRWSLQSQLFYLHEKVKQLKDIGTLLKGNSIIQDSPIYQDYFTYAKAQYILGHMTHDEFDLYEKYFNTIQDNIVVPDLIIQLNTLVHTLQNRIMLRDRVYEKTIDKSYLELLSRLQKEWVNSFTHTKILVIDTDSINLVNDLQQQKFFVELVKQNLV